MVLAGEMLMNTTIVYLSWNVAAFCMMAFDKNRARKRKMRIRERTIFLWALCFGAIGVLAGMYTFRHKTQHRAFVIGVPVLVIINFVSVYFLAGIGQ
jgi:uncharacterized membrane protein YsdA (DUF1294 family)